MANDHLAKQLAWRLSMAQARSTDLPSGRKGIDKVNHVRQRKPGQLCVRGHTQGATLEVITNIPIGPAAHKLHFPLPRLEIGTTDDEKVEVSFESERRGTIQEYYSMERQHCRMLSETVLFEQ